MMCKVTLLFPFGFLRLRVLSLILVLICWAVVATGVERGWYQGRFKVQQGKCPCLEEEFE
eukprot:183697-Pelagomonas_calceolata.AAC.1